MVRRPDNHAAVRTGPCALGVAPGSRCPRGGRRVLRREGPMSITCSCGGQDPPPSCSTTTTVLPWGHQTAQLCDKPAGIAGMQTHARLVEHKERPDEVGPNRRGQMHALHLAAGQRATGPIEGQVAQPHLVQTQEAGTDFLPEERKYLSGLAGQGRQLRRAGFRLEEGAGVSHREGRGTLASPTRRRARRGPPCQAARPRRPRSADSRGSGRCARARAPCSACAQVT